MNPLNSIKGTLICGFVLAIVIALVLNMGVGTVNWLTLVRWIHILAGITWIGLLYYFNFVQTPAMAVAAADKGGPGGAGVSKYVAPLALLWFRWSALLTWVMGFCYLAYRGSLGAFALGLEKSPVDSYELTIGVGAWLGTIMLFNVWVLIWPNQKKILGIVSATDEQKAKGRKIAGMASRINTLLSIPMIMCMASASHGLPLIHG
ncbi:MAG TPA: urate hydroxylase PuuD [Gammaproteobacteria bacterium]|nr:urate hydroxylase PuuD [Gammaproteobacteria bacterium]